MKIKPYKLYLISTIVVLFIFCEAHLFWLFPGLSESNYLSGGYLRLFMALMGIATTLYLSSKNKELKNCGYIYRLMIFTTIYLMAIYIYSLRKYPLQDKTETIGLGVTWLYVFWIIPLAYFIIYNAPKRGTEAIFDIFNELSIIWCIIRIFAWASYKVLGYLPFAFSRYVSIVGSGFANRTFGLRISNLEFANVAFVYCIYKVICTKSRKKSHILGLIFGTFCTIFVQQTRGFYIAFVIICLFAFFNYKIIAMRKIYRVLLIVIGMMLVLGTDFFSNIIGSFYKGSSIYGMQIRLGAYEYYWNCFLNSVWFGNGFAGSSHYYYVEHGGALGIGTYYYSDVGIIGSMGQVGLMGLVFMILVIVRMIHIINKYKIVDDVNLLSMLLIFVVITLPTLIITYTTNMFMLIVIIAYFEAYDYLHGKKQNNSIQLKGISL